MAAARNRWKHTTTLLLCLRRQLYFGPGIFRQFIVCVAAYTVVPLLAVCCP